VPFRVQPCKSFTGQRLPAGRSRAADEPDGRPSRKFYSWRCNSVLIGLTLLTLVMASAATAQTAALDRERAESHHGRSLQAEAVQVVVDSLRERLGITAVVTVTMVEHDDRRVSVRRAPQDRTSFALSVEQGFVEGLPREQLEAVLAHELGHVWIYTHHPYLQTEQLANRVAMRAVARKQLVAVYSTLWGADALHGSLEAFLGLETTTAAQE